MKQRGRVLIVAMAALAAFVIGSPGTAAGASPGGKVMPLGADPKVPAPPAPFTGPIDRLPGHSHGGSASANFLPYHWASRTVRYFNANRAIAPFVPKAAAAWNRSGVRFRWRAVPRRKADLLIVKKKFKKIAGWAQTAAGGRSGRIAIDPGLLGNKRAPRRLRQLSMVSIIAHEMGHIMGLAHQAGRCATMNATVWKGCPSPPATWLSICRILQPDDVRGAIRIWGGEARKPGRMYCPIEPDPGPVTPPVVQTGYVDALNRYAARAFVIVPPTARQGLRLIGAAGWAGFGCPFQDFLVNGGQDGVFGKHSFGDIASVPAVPGTFQMLPLTTGIPYASPPPTVCFAMRLYGKWGRPGPISQATVTFPAHG